MIRPYKYCEGSIHTSKNCGDFVITKHVSHNDITIKFMNTGFEQKVSYHSLRRKSVSDKSLNSVFGVGLTGETPTRINGKPTQEYQQWTDMLFRCYCVKFKKSHPSYKDCSISDNFKHYLYFKDWCNKQIGFNSLDEKGKSFALDKDILVKGNKMYSEDVCVFVPHEINCLFLVRRSFRGELPIGVHYVKSRGRYKSGLSCGGKSRHLGYFKTSEEAFCAYKQAKEAYIKEVANKWKDQIDPRVYKALIDYVVAQLD